MARRDDAKLAQRASACEVCAVCAPAPRGTSSRASCAARKTSAGLGSRHRGGRSECALHTRGTLKQACSATKAGCACIPSSRRTSAPACGTRVGSVVELISKVLARGSMQTKASAHQGHGVGEAGTRHAGVSTKAGVRGQRGHKAHDDHGHTHKRARDITAADVDRVSARRGRVSKEGTRPRVLACTHEQASGPVCIYHAAAAISMRATSRRFVRHTRG